MKNTNILKAIKYVSVFIVICFYGFVVMQSGVAAALAFFLKTLALVLFGLSHIWLFDLKKMLITVWRLIKWCSTSLLEYSRRSQSSSS